MLWLSCWERKKQQLNVTVSKQGGAPACFFLTSKLAKWMTSGCAFVGDLGFKLNSATNWFILLFQRVLTTLSVLTYFSGVRTEVWKFCNILTEVPCCWGFAWALHSGNRHQVNIGLKQVASAPIWLHSCHCPCCGHACKKDTKHSSIAHVAGLCFAWCSGMCFSSWVVVFAMCPWRHCSVKSVTLA